MTMVEIAGLTEVTTVERVGGHSHVRGLGLESNLDVPMQPADGLVGQAAARRALGVVLRMAQQGLIAGRAVLLSGQPGTGKTALAMGVAKGLGKDTPFVHISGSELYSLEISKTESLTQAFRRAIGVYIDEESDVIEGEVVELELERRGDDVGGKRVGRMTLATTEMESVYNLGVKMIEQLEQRNITAGDVIRIVKSTGVVTKLGRSFSRSRDFDAHGAETAFVKCPEGELQKRAKVTHRVTLHDLDVINSRSQGFLALFAGDTGEITSDTRNRIDEKVAEWRREGKANVVPGVLFVDEVHALDEECFCFLNRALEAPLAPVMIMATNRGVTRIKGTEYKAPHGIPLDLLDRCLIVPTKPYNTDEIRMILRERCNEEGYEVDETASELLAQIASNCSLRYALHLLTMSFVAARRATKECVSVEHVRRCYALFADTQRSVEYLLKHGASFLYNDVLPETDAHMMTAAAEMQ